jgi:flotillin
MSTAMMVAQAVIGGLMALVIFVFVLAVLRSVIRVCPSNQILVITGGTETALDGRKYGFRIQRGGWTIVIPFIQTAQSIELTILPVNVKIEGVNSANGISVGADATACVCVNDQNDTLLYSAVQQLLGKSRKQIHDQIQQTMMGNFRAALNKTTPLQAIGMVDSAEGVSDAELSTILPTWKKPDGTPATQAEAEEGERAIFRQVLLDDCQSDLSSFGMEVVSVSLQRIWDTSNYIANLANKTLSRKRQEVEIEEARLRARADQAESDANRRMAVAENGANERILAKKQEVEMFRRQCEADVTRARLEADSNIAQANNEAQRQIQEMNVELQKLKNQSQVTLAAEAQRRAAEIIAKGEGEVVDIVQGARNDLLMQKVQLLQRSGDQGKIALFITQLPRLFEAYRQHAATIKVDNMLVLNEEDGFNSAVNRGPAAMVDFMHRLEEGFGVSVKGLLSSAAPAGNGRLPTEGAAAPSGNGGKEA